jgi:hypothetical protein
MDLLAGQDTTELPKHQYTALWISSPNLWRENIVPYFQELATKLEALNPTDKANCEKYLLEYFEWSRTNLPDHKDLTDLSEDLSLLDELDFFNPTLVISIFFCFDSLRGLSSKW